MFRHFTTFLGGLLTGLLAAGLLLLIIRPHPRYPIELIAAPTAGPIQVHVAGAVLQPGVVEIPPGSIVEEALTAAGGPTEDADLIRLNLAEQLEMGQQIYVPSIETESSTPQTPRPYVADLSGRLNINIATAVDLQSLPGIGPSLATSIVEYREQHGWFQEPEELLDVSGIGPSKLDQISDLISFH